MAIKLHTMLFAFPRCLLKSSHVTARRENCRVAHYTDDILAWMQLHCGCCRSLTSLLHAHWTTAEQRLVFKRNCQEKSTFTHERHYPYSVLLCDMKEKMFTWVMQSSGRINALIFTLQAVSSPWLFSCTVQSSFTSYSELCALNSNVVIRKLRKCAEFTRHEIMGNANKFRS